MAIKKFGLNGVSSIVEFGKNGLKFKNNGTQFEARSNNELTLVEILAKDATTNQSVITKSQLDVALGDKQDNLSIAAGSQNYLQLDGGELSVKNLLIHDVIVDNTHMSLASYVTASYTGSEMQSGDILVLAAATDSQKKSFIHNGGSAGTVADFTSLQSDLSEAVIRGMFSAGTGISYNSTTGEISVDATASEITASEAGFAVVSGVSAQAMFSSIDTALATIQTDISNLEALSGAAGAMDLGTFTGGTISDNTTVKGALQELETKVEMVGSNLTDHCRKYSFDFEDAATFNLGDIVPAGKTFRSIVLRVDTPFNDIAATAKIGTVTDPEFIMKANENDLQDVGVYESSLAKDADTDLQLIVTLDKGTSTQGSGKIIVEYC